MTSKKTRVKIPMENKIKAELQKEIGSACPFCDSSEVGHFEIHHIDENPANNAIFNLVLLCPVCHSKITKGDIAPLEVLQKKIKLLTEVKETQSRPAKIINFNSKINNAVVGDNNTISIKQPKKTVQKYPEGCIGYDTIKANYISHLINRYNEYKTYDIGKEKMNYGAFGSRLKKEFKIGPTRTIYNAPIDRFGEVVSFIQLNIMRTKLAKVKGRSHKNYSSFEEYRNSVG